MTLLSPLTSRLPSLIGTDDTRLVVLNLANTIWHYVAFTFAIHQQQQCRGTPSHTAVTLLLVLSAPVFHFTYILPRLAPIPLIWLWTFGVFTWVLHSTSVLYLEGWTVPRPRHGYNWSAVFKRWNNNRRIPIPPSPKPLSPSSFSPNKRRRERLEFLARSFLRVATLLVAWAVTFVAGSYFLSPRPRDFRGAEATTYWPFPSSPSSLSSLSLASPAWPTVRRHLLRLWSLTQWYQGTTTCMTAAHALESWVFVVVLGVDEPEEWPLLFGGSLVRVAWSVEREAVLGEGLASCGQARVSELCEEGGGCGWVGG